MSYSHAIAKSITLVTNGWLNKTGIENGSHHPCPRDLSGTSCLECCAEQEPGATFGLMGKCL